jgi:D-glycero-alpha-D-manno-heptose-7-phosphate kinase
VIIVKAPSRVSFCGGGSDLPAFYTKHGGAVLSAGLSRYIYISIHPYFYSDQLVCKYSKNEIVHSPDQLKHPIFRVVLEKFGIKGVEITSTADIPAGTGLGSSSSFTVALLHALYAYTSKYVSPERLAAEACEIEIDLLKESIGKQDQYAAAFGGLHVYRFNKDGHVAVEPVLMSNDAMQRLENNLLMFYTGDIHNASKILSEQSKNVVADHDKERSQLKISKYTDELHKELIRDNIDAMGPLLYANWEEKRKLAKGITNTLIDDAFEKAMFAGATGGKLLGAGGGGFLLFYVPEHRHTSVKNALSNLRCLKFGFSRSGSSVIYVGDKTKGC